MSRHHVLGCDTDWHYYDDYCYYTSTTKANQQKAQDRCHEMDAELASISDQAEMDFVESIS